MKAQESIERKINLPDLFWNIIAEWRRLICFGILFAVLVCCMRYFLDVRDYHEFQNIDIEEQKSNLDEKEREQLANAVDLQGRIDKFNHYLAESAVMQIDPYAKPVIELQYYVKSAYITNYTQDRGHDYTAELFSMYNNYIQSGEMAQKVVDGTPLSISAEDFRELVSTSNPRAGDSGTIFFCVSFADDGTLIKIVDVMKRMLEEKAAEFQKVGPHKLQLISQSQNTIVDTALADRKNTIANNVTTLNMQLMRLMEAMPSELITLFDLEVREMRGEGRGGQELPGFHIKYMALGAVLGFFLICAWAAYRMFCASKLQSPKEISDMYGLRLLGEIEPLKQKKRFLPGVDKLIVQLKNRRKRALTTEQQIGLIAAKAVLLCKKKGIGSVYMTGSEYEKADGTILDKLKKEISRQNMKVQDGGSILRDIKSLQAGMENGCLVLVEQKGLSAYTGIYAELKLVEEYQGEVLGVVVL